MLFWLNGSKSASRTVFCACMKKTKPKSESKAKANKTSSRPARAGPFSDLYQLIVQQPLFKGLSPSQFELLTGLAMEIHFTPGEYIFRRQDPANRFYVILEGKVELELTSSRHGTKSLLTAGPGDYVGSAWLFEPYSFHVSAKVIEPTRSIFFYGTKLREHCEDNHDLGYEIMKRVAGAALKRLIAFQQDIPAWHKNEIADTPKKNDMKMEQYKIRSPTGKIHV
jgi:CRP/FNR family cyclic AMP-dependent transcriptional regulator